MERRNRLLLPISRFGLCLCLLLASCGRSGEGALRETVVRLKLPRIPASWGFLGEFRYALLWRDSLGLDREAFCAPGESPAIDLAPGAMSAVSAWPECRLGRMRPAGALYPLDLGTGACPSAASGAPLLELSWEGGWLAEVFSRLEESGRDSELFNFARLEAEIEERGGDPWELDPGLAARRLMRGSLRRDFFRQVKRYAVELPPQTLPEEGAEGWGWALESALAPAPSPAGGEGGSGRAAGPWTAFLPAGSSLVIGKDFDLAAKVEPGGSALLVRLPRD